MNRLSALALPLLAFSLFAAACSPAPDAGTSTPPATADTSTTGPQTTTDATATEAATTVPTTTSATNPVVVRAGEAGIGDPYFPHLGNGGYDVTHYDLDLGWDPETRTLSAVALIEAVATEDLDTFNLDFSSMTVDDVAVRGTTAGFEHDQPELVITPEVPLAAGEPFTVRVGYHGVPSPHVGDAVPFGIGWTRGPRGEEYVVAEPDGAHTWFPSNDHPIDKATFDISITVPEGFIAAANGALQGTEPAHDGSGGITWHWHMGQPMATYLATVIIAEDWELVDPPDTTEVDIRHVLPADLAADPPEPLETTDDMITFFSDVFGPYPFDEYGIAVVQGFGAALENQSLSLFDRAYVEAPFFEIVLAHELAHQWFGNSVTPARWKDVWLNEGFATFAEFLWIEHRFGADAYDNVVQQRRAEIAGAQLTPPGAPPPGDLFGASVYIWGGLALDALRAEIGDDAFFETLRGYAADFAYGNATTEDFIAAAERTSGVDLEEFFEAWLYGSTLPVEG